MNSWRKWICACLATASCLCAACAQRPSDEAKLRKLHKELLQFHQRDDVAGWLDTEAEQYVVANRGEVSHPSKQERAARIGPYLQRTQFSEYRDLIEPEVRVSRDGSLAWLIAQVKAAGTQTTDDGKQEPLEFTSAWIELYQKQDGKWLRVGNVSNFRPAGESQ